MSKLIARNVPVDALPLADRFLAVRQLSERLAQPLSPEDQTVQSMPDASPTKWHLAHTTWFFETFVLRRMRPDYRTVRSRLRVSLQLLLRGGRPAPSAAAARACSRGRGVEEIMAYRRHVSDAMAELLDARTPRRHGRRIVELGLHHEQQHQELILMDAKHLLSLNPLFPAYRAGDAAPGTDATPLGLDRFRRRPGRDRPRRPTASPSTTRGRATASGSILCARRRGRSPAASTLAFIEDGGYRRPEFWLSAGWDCVNQRDWQAPLYWQRDGDHWHVFTLAGLRPMRACRAGLPRQPL